MQLLRGAEVEKSLLELLQHTAGIPALVFDPEAYQGVPPRIAVIATTEQSRIVDLSASPNLGEQLKSHGLLCATDGKAHHRILLNTYGVGPARWACIKLTETLLSGGIHRDLSLDAIAQRYHLAPLPNPEESLQALASYGTCIAKIVAAQIPELKKAGMTRVSKLEASAVAPIAEMEYNGMCIDSTSWQNITAEAQTEKESIADHTHKHIRKNSNSSVSHDLLGSPNLNLNSNTELLEALHQLGHKVPNLKKETLKSLPAPLGPWLVRYRELAKMVSTYGESFLDHVGPDARIHPTFEQIGASTGRMACHSPNLQAVLKASKYRDCFRCAPHRRLVVADYATCELRILAQISGDPVFRRAFAQGEDLHSTVASALWNKPVSKTENPDLRHRAKAVNFGLVYGMGPGGLAKTLEISRHNAQILLRDYFHTFPTIKDFLESSSQLALRRGYAETLTGRKLYFGPLDSPQARAQAERIAKNMPIQGTSADMTKLAMANLHPKLQLLPHAYLVNAVHDELVVECDATNAPEVVEILKKSMIDAGKSLLPDIPIEVDVQVGLTWDK